MRTSLLVSLLTFVATQPLSLPENDAALTLRDSTLTERANDQTENDLISGPCKSVTLIFARGTGQGGNIGNDVGPSLMSELAKRIGDKNLARQGVNYPASWVTFPGGGDINGMVEVMNLIRNGVKKCPKTKFVLAGHSQGAEVIAGGVHRCVAAEVKKIAAVVLFGAPPSARDPFPQVAASKVKVICHKGDSICDGQLLPNDKHEGYVKDTATGANFIASKL